MTQTISHQDIVNHLFKLSESRDYLIAFSGGLDSSVLLHLMHEASIENSQINLASIHINHGISRKSTEWSEFCRNKCNYLGVSYQSFTVDLTHNKGQSLEASARESRYAILGEQLNTACVLLTAHHRDDQCETLLLQLFRGSGLSGIASMPEIQDFYNGYLARPLLSLDRETIKRYAIDKGIEWTEDESNLDTNIDRNYIRHDVLPVIKGRWPSANKTIARAANHAAETASLANLLGKQDCSRSKLIGCDVLSVSAIRQLSDARQRNLLRSWIREHQRLMPSSIILERILTESIKSAVDRNPRVKWGNVEVRRHSDRLYILDQLPEVDNNAFLSLDQAYESLPLGKLLCEYTNGNGIDTRLLGNRSIFIGFRSGGETIFPNNSPYSRRVKKLMSEWGVPPWLRDLMPLAFVDNELVAIPGICIDKNWSAPSFQSSINLIWQLPEHLEKQNLPFTRII